MSQDEFRPNPSARDVFHARTLQLLEKRNQVQESSLQSTRNALSMIIESEQVGIRTGEELLNQREKLTKVDTDLDHINSNLRQTQKNIKQMSGFFNGISSLFRKQNKGQEELKQQQATMSSSQSASNVRAGNELSANMNKLRSNSAQYEGLKRNSSAPNTQGPIDFDDEPLSQNKLDKKSEDMEAQLEDNLSGLSMGLGRLKDLALGLGREITDQNEFLDKITSKSERVDDTIKFQNKQLQKHLAK